MGDQHLYLKWQISYTINDDSNEDRQTDSFDLGHEPTHPPTLFQAGSASASPTSQRLTGITSVADDSDTLTQ